MLALACMYCYRIRYMIKSQVPLRTRSIAKHRRRKTKVTLPTFGVIIHA